MFRFLHFYYIFFTFGKLLWIYFKVIAQPHDSAYFFIHDKLRLLHRKTIYRWRERYDGTLKSLVNKSRKPHRSPRAHTKQELKLIRDYKNKNKDTGLVVLWVKLRKVGYTRSVTSLYRTMVRMGIYKKAPSKKKVYEPKAYHQMTYPGQRVQVDVKYVPMKCMTKELKEQGERYYQYTAIDEYTRL